MNEDWENRAKEYRATCNSQYVELLDLRVENIELKKRVDYWIGLYKEIRGTASELAKELDK